LKKEGIIKILRIIEIIFTTRDQNWRMALKGGKNYEQKFAINVINA